MSNASFVTYATGRSMPCANIEVRDLDGRVLGTCSADSAGQWNVALPEIVHWIEIHSADETQRARAAFQQPSSAAAFHAAGSVCVPELTIHCWSLAERFASPVLRGQGVGGRTTAEPGQRISATIGGRRFDTVVGEDGTWVIPFDAETVEALADGIHLLCVTVRDREGNEAIVWDEVVMG